ncbi:hypothetical protein [Colwellia sp. MEBiC06753]
MIFRMIGLVIWLIISPVFVGYAPDESMKELRHAVNTPDSLPYPYCDHQELQYSNHTISRH